MCTTDNDQQISITGMSSPESEEIQKEEKENLEFYTLLWCDENVNSTEDNKKLQKELRRLINYIRIFDSVDKCQQYIESEPRDEQIILVVSGRAGRKLVSNIHSLVQIIGIYVYCVNDEEHKLWAELYEKVKAVVNKEDELIKHLIKDQQSRLKLDINGQMTFFSHQRNITTAATTTTTTASLPSLAEYTHQNLDSGFMWFQLVIEVFLRMGIESRRSAFQELITNCREQYKTNKTVLDKIKTFEEWYDKDKAIYYYTCDFILYRILNRALRCQDVNTLLTLSFFIHDIYEELKSEQKFDDSPLHTYHGQRITENELEKMKNSVGKCVSMNSFWSTTKHRHLALIYAGSDEHSTTANDIGVLFEIEADTLLKDTKPFADIRKDSAFGEDEAEILFMLGSIFRIQNVYWNQEEDVWIIKLILSGENEFELKPLFDSMKHQIQLVTDLLSLGFIYWDMGKYDEAEKYLKLRLKSSIARNTYYDGMCYITLGNIACKKELHDTAYDYYTKAFRVLLPDIPQSEMIDLIDDIKEEMLDSFYLPTVAVVYMNLGNLFQQRENFVESIKFYAEALKIGQKAGWKNSLDEANVFHNIAVVFYKQQHYDLALTNFRKSLQIKEQKLSKFDFSIASTLVGIGSVCKAQKKPTEAIQNFEKAKLIQLKCIPHHPATAQLYINIGLTYEYDYVNYIEALANYKEALRIYKLLAMNENDDLNVDRTLATIDRINQWYAKHVMWLGNTYYNLDGCMQFAEKCYKFLLKILPEDTYDLSELYARLDDISMSKGK